MSTRTLPVSKRGLNFEMFMWGFTRVTVIVMYGLILAGLVGGLIVSGRTGTNLGEVFYWAFFPGMAPNPLGQVWMTVVAKSMVTAFVLAACGHGVHGVLEIWDDYVPSEGSRRRARNIVITYAVIASIIAAYAIWTA